MTVQYKWTVVSQLRTVNENKKQNLQGGGLDAWIWDLYTNMQRRNCSMNSAEIHLKHKSRMGTKNRWTGVIYDKNFQDVVGVRHQM